MGDPFHRHDHGACVAEALLAAESACAARGVALTPLRRRTLEILLEGHAALGAYEVLSRLSAEGLGSQPPVAYRALNFLVGQGLAHRLQGLQAFVACARPGAPHAASFLVCRSCRTVLEAGAPPAPPEAEAAGFAVETVVQESEGLCPACRGAP